MALKEEPQIDDTSDAPELDAVPDVNSNEEELLGSFDRSKSLFKLLDGFDDDLFDTKTSQVDAKGTPIKKDAKIRFVQELEALMSAVDLPLDELTINIIIFKQQRSVAVPAKLGHESRKKSPAERALIILREAYKDLIA